MSDTPKTDAAAYQISKAAEGLIMVPVNFARQLERELAAAHADLLYIANMREYDQDDALRLRNIALKAASKIKLSTK